MDASNNALFFVLRRKKMKLGGATELSIKLHITKIVTMCGRTTKWQELKKAA